MPCIASRGKLNSYHFFSFAFRLFRLFCLFIFPLICRAPASPTGTPVGPDYQSDIIFSIGRLRTNQSQQHTG